MNLEPLSLHSPREPSFQLPDFAGSFRRGSSESARIADRPAHQPNPRLLQSGKDEHAGTRTTLDRSALLDRLRFQLFGHQCVAHVHPGIREVGSAGKDLPKQRDGAVVLAAIALLASYIPALRAMRGDPMIALSHNA